MGVVVDVAPAHAIAKIVPLRSIGAGLDAENPGASRNVFSAADVGAMLGSGLGPVTYRLYTELGVQAWHWNPAGAWSDPAHRQGYWTSASQPDAEIGTSFGYRLPSRGDTYDTANNDDYSRLDDGDPSTYWKSDPYLAQRYTGDPDAAHPQWIVVSFARIEAVDAIRLAWANPYARAYRVQYWLGNDAMFAPSQGRWADFPGGTVASGGGGTVTLRLAASPVRVGFVRVLMTASSNTCDARGSRDPRDCTGYAIGEVGIGTVDANGRFRDAMSHAPNHRQTVTYVSSTDPWHAAADRDLTDEVQPGLDALFASGVTRGLPAFVPVSMLYGTPSDAAAEIAYLERRGDRLRGVELGEEPDGQFVLPEDYGALYVQWSRAIHRIDPSLPLGGPVFQGVTSDVLVWPNASGDTSWLHRFILYLQAHGALGSLRFMSFEHYPFDACDPSPWNDLRAEPQLARHVMETWRADGVPASVPFYVTEMNFSANAGAVFQELPGALWLADAAGAFLSAGARGVFLYQYAPEPLQHTVAPCDTWGAYGMFTGTGVYRVRQRTAQYFAAQMVDSRWAQPVDAPHALLRSTSFWFGSPGAFSSYAILRPDGRYAVMLIDKDPLRPLSVQLRFADGSKSYRFVGKVSESVFGAAQYSWHAAGAAGYAAPDGPIAESTVEAAGAYLLEPGSITVLRGRIAR